MQDLSASRTAAIPAALPLRIPAGFGNGQPGGLPGGGINPATGMYDPAPVFWGAAAGGDGSGTGGYYDNAFARWRGITYTFMFMLFFIYGVNIIF